MNTIVLVAVNGKLANFALTNLWTDLASGLAALNMCLEKFLELNQLAKIEQRRLKKLKKFGNEEVNEHEPIE